MLFIFQQRKWLNLLCVRVAQSFTYKTDMEEHQTHLAHTWMKTYLMLLINKYLSIKIQTDLIVRRQRFNVGRSRTKAGRRLLDGQHARRPVDVQLSTSTWKSRRPGVDVDDQACTTTCRCAAVDVDAAKSTTSVDVDLCMSNYRRRHANNINNDMNRNISKHVQHIHIKTNRQSYESIYILQ